MFEALATLWLLRDKTFTIDLDPSILTDESFIEDLESPYCENDCEDVCYSKWDDDTCGETEEYPDNINRPGSYFLDHEDMEDLLW